VTRGFMGPLGGFWPKLGRKRVTGWKQRSCVPPGRVKTNKQTIFFFKKSYLSLSTEYTYNFLVPNIYICNFEKFCKVLLLFFLGFASKKYDQTDSRAPKCLPRVTKTVMYIVKLVSYLILLEKLSFPFPAGIVFPL
jgi:hypothetical protein